MIGSARLRWVFAEGFAHVLAEDNTDDAATLAAVCGLTVPATVPVYGVAPSLDVCGSCVPMPGDALDVPPPTFPAPPSVFSSPGRSPVEHGKARSHHRCASHPEVPGDRPVPTQHRED